MFSALLKNKKHKKETNHYTFADFQLFEPLVKERNEFGKTDSTKCKWAKTMGSATGCDGWDTSQPIFLLFNTTPMGVAWKESTPEGLHPPQYSEAGGAPGQNLDTFSTSVRARKLNDQGLTSEQTDKNTISSPGTR